MAHWNNQVQKDALAPTETCGRKFAWEIEVVELLSL